MMICPETFYEMNIKGKNVEEIESVICELEEEIDRLKKIVAAPDYVCHIHPSEKVRISCLKDYLKRAKQALKTEKLKR